MKQYMKSVPIKGSSSESMRNSYYNNKTSDVEDYNPYMNKLSIDEIRGHFHSTYKRHNDITSQRLRKKEEELIRESQARKQKKEAESQVRYLNTRVMADLSLEYTDLRHKPKAKDLKVTFLPNYFWDFARKVIFKFRESGKESSTAKVKSSGEN